MFLPIETKNFDTRFGQTKGRDQTFDTHVICLLNHEIDADIEAILDGSKQVAPVLGDSAAKYRDFDPSKSPLCHPLFLKTFGHIQKYLNQVTTVLYDADQEFKVLNLVESIMSKFSMKTFKE